MADVVNAVLEVLGMGVSILKAERFYNQFRDCNLLFRVHFLSIAYGKYNVSDTLIAEVTTNESYNYLH
jgi:hypothetical protein